MGTERNYSASQSKLYETAQITHGIRQIKAENVSLCRTGCSNAV